MKVVVSILAVLTLGAGCVAILGSNGGGVAAIIAQEEAAKQTCTAAPVANGQGVDGLTEVQVRNYSRIIAIGKDLTATQAMDPYAYVIAVAVAKVESQGMNLASEREAWSLDFPHDDVAKGDHRSVGIMQQQAGIGWGANDQLMQVDHQVRAFFGGPTAPIDTSTGRRTNPGLLDKPDWQRMSLANAAQAVQGSAYPHKYADQEQFARDVVAKLADGVVAAGPCGGSIGVGDARLPLPADHIATPIGPHHDYPAIDFGVPAGVPVFAAVGGTARHIDGGFGLGVQITDGDGNVWIYGHHSARPVADGQIVAAGSKIGEVGNTGQSRGDHLHLEIRLAGSGTKVCPQSWVEAVKAGQSPPPVAQLPTSGCIGPSLR